MMRRLIIFVFIATGMLRADVLDEVHAYILSRLEANQEAVAPSAKCGFREAMELQQYYHLLSPQWQKLAKPLLEMPKRQYQVTSPSGHFILHYDLTGIHAVPSKDSLGNGIPDYIDSAAVILDHVWDVEINQLGFRPPPDSTGQPVQSYPVFFSSINYYGLTNFNMQEDIPELPGQNYVSYLELHRNFSGGSFATNGLEALKVTAAHEFHHAIQLGYQFRWKWDGPYLIYPDLFFMEMSSTFMEDYVYDSINDYVQYVNKFLPVADAKPFNVTDNNTEYANSLYLHMLTKVHGVNIFRQIWETIIRYPALDALDLVLRKYDDSFSKSFNQYACWLYFSGHYADSLHYFKDGHLFTDLEVSRDVTKLNEDLGAYQMRHVRILIDVPGVYRAKVHCPSKLGRMNHVINTQTLQNSVPFNREQYFTQSNRYPLIVVLTNGYDTPISDISYQVDLAPAMVERNPVVVTQRASEVRFVNVPLQAEIKIFNVLGQLVTTLHNGANDVVSWDYTNRQHHRLSSGAYFYLITAKQFKKAGRFILVR